jgi:hypothetical protein
MASEARGDQGKLPKPVLGTLLGFFLVYGALRVVLNALVGFDFGWAINFIHGWTVVIIALLVGAGLGGLIQLWTQGRAAEIPRFLRQLYLSLFKLLFFLWVPMFLAAWLGDRLYGSMGHDIGLVVSAVLIIPIWCWLVGRSSGEKPSTPASGLSGESPAAGTVKRGQPE